LLEADIGLMRHVRQRSCLRCSVGPVLPVIYWARWVSTVCPEKETKHFLAISRTKLQRF